jgi:hydroxyacylglutathione hydrolase
MSPSKLPGAREEEVVVYCGRGPRARLAVALMWYAGFRQVDLLRGHMAGWRKSRFREEK